MADVKTGSIFYEVKVESDEAKKKLDGFSNSVSNLNKLFGLFKVSVFLKGLQSIGDVISKNILKQSEYIQVQSLFNKTMGDSVDKATKFRDTMESKLGIDPQDTMQSMSAFQRLTETFGIAEDRAYIMSKNMTQLAADMTSYGYSFENAMQKLKSGLSRRN